MLAGAEISTLAAASNCRRGVELFKRGCAFAHKNWARGRRPNMACERRSKKKTMRCVQMYRYNSLGYEWRA
mgnify:CR=1 FL=1